MISLIFATAAFWPESTSLLSQALCRSPQPRVSTAWLNSQQGAHFPARLLKALNRAGENREAVQRVGVQHAAEQCAGLLDQGVDGIHFYTLNQSKATREVYALLGMR